VIASVEGRVGAVAFDSLVIEVGGIGYRVFAAPAILATAQPGSTIKLHTYHLVREDQQSLFGFRTTEDLGFFNLLLTGIGKKLADRIIFELKEKVAAAGIAASTLAGSGIGASESEVVGALQALGYSLAEAREASRIALSDATIGGTLEDRVKAALRSLLRD
jgi:Holliday junction DNA helicase RuvA